MYSSFRISNLLNASHKFYSFNVVSLTTRQFNSITHQRFTHQTSRSNKSRARIMANGNSENFSLNDYDCIGFDLDCTLVKYNVNNMIRHEYSVLSNFLVVDRGYSKALLKPFDEGVDFIQKGLILDFKKGNLLRICPDGSIQIASHGTRFLSKEEIIAIYGEEKRWQVTDEYCKDMLCAWNGTLSEFIRTCLDYFDMPAALCFARIVDSIDLEKGGMQDEYNVWPDVLAGLLSMYERSLFATKESKYFEAIKADPARFIDKCKPEVLDFLKNLKEKKKSFLITGSHIDFASFTAGYALGEKWRDYFDLIICYAKKPGFFQPGLNREFMQLEGIKETQPIKFEDMKIGNVYTQGNFNALRKFISKITQKEDPKILYVGDNLIQDVFTPNKHCGIDSIAIIEEMMAEGVDYNQNYEILRSSLWGSYFHTNGEDTLWEQIIRKHSKICVPCVDEIAKNPLDHKYRSFNPNDSSSCGYYPHDPFDPYVKTQ